MTVRWRLAVAGVQLAILLIATYAVVGRVVVGETWLLAGLLAVVVNPQLLEPWYPKPQDVLANTIIAGTLVMLSAKTVASPGWSILGAVLAIFFVAALLALALGASRDEGPGVGLGRAAQNLTGVASALGIYSAVFWLSLLEYRPSLNEDFWTLGGAWIAIVLVGRINWQAALANVTGAALPCVPEGMVGPSRLMISSSSLPEVGWRVRLEDRKVRGEGVVTTRVRRANDVWGEVFIESADDCDALVQRSALRLQVLDPNVQADFAGSVDSGSTNESVKFLAARDLVIGSVVTIDGDGARILYQLTSAEVDQVSIRGGSHLVVRARGAQLGSFDPATWRILRHQWVPAPGAAVRTVVPAPQHDTPPETHYRLGVVEGTEIPVYLDTDSLQEGHLAILGMTRMGKTSLAVRLAEALALTSRVTILDQTGEYIGKRGLTRYDPTHDVLDTGLSVFEPTVGRVAADEALAFLRRLVNQAAVEYANGTPRARVVLIDEAHQFVPEPAGLGFNAPGRDSSFQFGLLMMQVRKYGITIVLISQRTAVVAKSAISQCESLIAFKNVDQTGLDYLEAILGSEARRLLPTLGQGQAVAFGPAITSEAPVVMRVDVP